MNIFIEFSLTKKKHIIVASVPMCGLSDLDCLSTYRYNITNIKDCMQCELSCSKTVYNIEKLIKKYMKTINHTMRFWLWMWPLFIQQYWTPRSSRCIGRISNMAYYSLQTWGIVRLGGFIGVFRWYCQFVFGVFLAIRCRNYILLYLTSLLYGL